MTGDDHGNGGTAGRFDQYEARQPGRLLGRRLGVRPRDLLHLPEHARSPTPQAAAYQAAGLRDRAARHHQLRQTGRRRRSSRASTSSQLAELARQLSRACARRPPTAPTASPGATGRRSRRSSSSTASASTPTTTTGRRQWIQDRPGMFTGLRHADALRRPRRLDDRRLPGGDPDDRRVGPDLPVHDRHAARQRARARRATTASSPPTCTPTTHRSPGSDAIVAVGAGARRAGRLGTPDADLARRPQRLLVRRDLPGTASKLDFTIDAGRRRERPAGDGADQLARRAP